MMTSVAFPVGVLLLLLPTVHFSSLLPGLVHGHRNARATRLSDSDAVHHQTVTAARGLDMSDTSSDVLKQLDTKFAANEESKTLHLRRPSSSSRWRGIGERDRSDGLPRRKLPKNLAKKRVVLSNLVRVIRQYYPDSVRNLRDDAFKKTNTVDSSMKLIRDKLSHRSPNVVLGAVKDSWRTYNTHPTPKCNYSTPERPRRSLAAYPYNSVGLHDVTNHAVSDKTSSTVDTVLLKHRLQKIYRLFLTDDTISGTDVLQDTLNEFSKRGSAQGISNTQTASNSPVNAGNDLNPTAYSQLAQKHSSDRGLDDREAEIIAEEQPMDPYLIEYLETVRPTGKEDTHKEHRTSEATWLAAERQKSGDDPAMKRAKVVAMSDLAKLPADISGDNSGLNEGDVIVVNRRSE
ncbi:hypothetical protein ACOMHN_053788 [Nucella lapillus]